MLSNSLNKGASAQQLSSMLFHTLSSHHLCWLVSGTLWFFLDRQPSLLIPIILVLWTILSPTVKFRWWFSSHRCSIHRKGLQLQRSGYTEGIIGNRGHGRKECILTQVSRANMTWLYSLIIKYFMIYFRNIHRPSVEWPLSLIMP